MAQTRKPKKPKDVGPLGFALAGGIAFGAVGLMIGVTIPGPVQGTSFISSVVWALVLGALAFVAGLQIGRSLDEVHRRGSDTA